VASVIYIVAIGSIGGFLFWIVDEHERDHNAAVVLKLLIAGVGFAAIVQPLLSLFDAR
jgi:hypothetical protein